MSEGKHKPHVARYMANYARSFQDCFLGRDLSALLGFSAGKRRLVMASLSALAKFRGEYDDWRRLASQYNLKWAGKSKDDVFIERLNKIQNPEEIWQWIRDLKRLRPEFAVFVDFLAVTGLRLVEAVSAYNLVIKLAAERKLADYYVHDKAVLEHYKFKELFLRNTKKAFVSFVPQDLVYHVAESKQLNKFTIQTSTKRVLPLRFSDVREAHATFMTKYLKQQEIDFLHGRVTGSVFMQHYFNPALIVDLRTRVFQGISEIQEKVKV
ncbi:MAG: integrase [Candidatus Bathyarchaeota archaeon]|nr:integrase [Candidatus Bathyarchaeota archaeon]